MLSTSKQAGSGLPVLISVTLHANKLAQSCTSRQVSGNPSNPILII